MPQPGVLNAHPPKFEQFLYQSVGEDRNGNLVTVLSALARLGLDPWAETADLATLEREAARTRLATLLERFRDVPTLARDHGKVARDLSQLLPESSTATDGHPRTSSVIWPILAIVFVVFQMLTFGGSGSGQ
jgi:hypothetical protein